MYSPGASSNLKFNLNGITFGVRTESQSKFLLYNFQSSTAIIVDAFTLLDLASYADNGKLTYNLSKVLDAISVSFK